MWANCSLVTVTEEILHGKLHFLCIALTFNKTYLNLQKVSRDFAFVNNTRLCFLNKTSTQLLNSETMILEIIFRILRSTHRRCSVKKGVLGNFAKSTGKHLCQSLFFNKVKALRPATLVKERLWHWCFLVSFGKFSKKTFLRNTSGQLLMNFITIKNTDMGRRKITNLLSLSFFQWILHYCSLSRS